MFIYFIAQLFIYEVLAIIDVLDKGIIPIEKGSIGIQFYLDIGNKDTRHSCTAHSWAKRCCLVDPDTESCSRMFVYGADAVDVLPQDRETLILVYPTLIQYDQVGYCDFILETNCHISSLRSRRQVFVPFDTRVTHGDAERMKLLASFKDVGKNDECDSIDEDRLSACVPVKCNEKYLGIKPFYNNILSKCVVAPICDGDYKAILPDIVYDPKTNVCRDSNNVLNPEDIIAITTGAFHVNKANRTKSDTMKIVVKSNCTTLSENLQFLFDLAMGKLYPPFNGDASDYGQCCKIAMLKILAYVTGICACLLTCVCCIFMSIGLYEKYQDGSLGDAYENLKNRCTRGKSPSHHNISCHNSEVTNSLLREVIVRDLPMELMCKTIDVCERMGNSIKSKQRYRRQDLGSHYCLSSDDSLSDFNSSECGEKEKLLK